MKSSSGISLLRIFRIVCLLSIAFLIVYAYRLYVNGDLIEQLLKITTYIMNVVEKNPLILLGILSYASVFYWGYRVGKQKKR